MNNNSGIETPYVYESQLGLSECLRMLYDDETDYVVIQDPRFQCIDDVVISKNEKLINIQVKHTSTNKTFSYSSFWGKQDENSLLVSLMKDWEENYDKYKISEIRIYSNKKFGTNKVGGCVSFNIFVKNIIPKLKKNYYFKGKNKFEQCTVKKFKDILEKTLDEKACLFLKSLSFKTTQSLDCVLKEQKNIIKAIIGNDDDKVVDSAYASLQTKLITWCTDLRKDFKITKEQVYEALMDNTLISSYSFLPKTPIFPSRINFGDEISNKINNSQSKIIFVSGKPGCGKTNLVSYLCTKDNPLFDFRFYTYYPAEKCDGIYSDDYGRYSSSDLWLCILFQLKEFFKSKKLLFKYKFPLVFKYLNQIELRKITLKYLAIYRTYVGKCNVVIDGIDHAARLNNSWNTTYLSEIPKESDIPKGVKFIVVGQPGYDYPFSNVETIHFPEINATDICLLVEHINNEKMDKLSISNLIIDIVGNNTLNIIFAIKEIEKLPVNFSFEDLKNILTERKLDKNISNYYEWIFNSSNNDSMLKLIIILFAYLNLKINIDDLALIFEVNRVEMTDIISKLYPLVIVDNEEKCYVYHNDVKLFFRNKCLENRDYSLLTKSLLSFLENNKKVKHNILVDLLMNSNLNLFEYYNLNYLKECFDNSINYIDMYEEMLKVIRYFVVKKNVYDVSSINIFLTTICQMKYVYEYYKSNNVPEYFSKKIRHLESEVYRLNISDKYGKILSDICYRIHNDDIDKANYLFNFYLEKLDKNVFLNKINLDANVSSSVYHNLGFVFRFYKIFIDQCFLDGINFNYFAGWMECSKLFVDEYKINLSCFTKKYNLSLIEEYFTYVISNDVNSKHYEQLKFIVNTYPLEYKYRIDLFEKYKNSNEINYLYDNIKELVSSSKRYALDYFNFYRLLKILFISHPNFTLYDEVNSMLCNKLNYVKSERSFPIVKLMFESTIKLCKYILEIEKYESFQIKKIFEDIVFADKKYGTGSASDCDYYQIRNVILYLIKTLCNQSIDLSKIILRTYIDISSAIQIPIFWEITDLFCIDSLKEDGLNFYKKYYNPSNGYIWKYENDSMLYDGNKIVIALSKLGYIEEANKLSYQLEYRKNIGFVGHKDYSLMQIDEWIKSYIQFRKDDLITTYVPHILSINDYAANNGDNRMHSSIEKTIIKYSINQGPIIFDAIFSLKNNPRSFYIWRMNTSEVISELDDNTFAELQTLFEKWNLHQRSNTCNDKITSVTHEIYSDDWEIFLQNIQNLITSKNGKENDILIELSSILPQDKRIEFYNKIIKSKIFKKVNYGIKYEGIGNLIDKYYDVIPEKDYFELIKNSFSRLKNYDDLYFVKEDINLLWKNLVIKNGHEMFKSEFDKIISMFDIWIGHPFIVNIDSYYLSPDYSINSYQKIIKKQLMK